jgi:hypothetical protein
VSAVRGAGGVDSSVVEALEVLSLLALLVQKAQILRRWLCATPAAVAVRDAGSVDSSVVEAFKVLN